jgi:hypothetical protein
MKDGSGGGFGGACGVSRVVIAVRVEVVVERGRDGRAVDLMG